MHQVWVVHLEADREGPPELTMGWGLPQSIVTFSAKLSYFFTIEKYFIFILLKCLSRSYLTNRQFGISSVWVQVQAQQLTM